MATDLFAAFSAPLVISAAVFALFVAPCVIYAACYNAATFSLCAMILYLIRLKHVSYCCHLVTYI